MDECKKAGRAGRGGRFSSMISLTTRARKSRMRRHRRRIPTIRVGPRNFTLDEERSEGRRSEGRKVGRSEGRKVEGRRSKVEGRRSEVEEERGGEGARSGADRAEWCVTVVPQWAVPPFPCLSFHEAFPLRQDAAATGRRCARCSWAHC